jgi:hypothetical protein
MRLKGFDTVSRQTLLATQHEIIELEEAMSQGTHVPTEIKSHAKGTETKSLKYSSIAHHQVIQVLQRASFSHETAWAKRKYSAWETSRDAIA